MFVYVKSGTEFQSEDSMSTVPLPEYPPTTGLAFDNGNAVAVGNRVLECITKHKEEVKLRMAATERGFRTMLEKSLPTEHQPKRSMLASKNSPHMVRVSFSNRLGKPISISAEVSDEYLGIPNGSFKQKEHTGPSGTALPTKKEDLMHSACDDASCIYEPDEGSDIDGASRLRQDDSNSHNRPPHKTGVLYQRNNNSVNLPTIPNQSMDDDAASCIYEPNEASDIEETSCGKDASTMNNNPSSSITRVQFYLPNAAPTPNGRLTNHDEPAEIEDTPSRLSYQGADQETTESQPNTISKRSLPLETTGSKHLTKGVKSKHSTAANVHGTAPAQNNGGSASSSPKRHHSESKGANNWFIVLFVVAILIVVVGLLIFTFSGGRSETKNDDGDGLRQYELHYGPVM